MFKQSGSTKAKSTQHNKSNLVKKTTQKKLHTVAKNTKNSKNTKKSKKQLNTQHFLTKKSSSTIPQIFSTSTRFLSSSSRRTGPFSDLSENSAYVDREWLAGQYDDQCHLPDDLKIVTPYSPAPNQYMIPHSRKFALGQFSHTFHGKPNTFPLTPQEWEDSIAKIGIKKGDNIVVYDASGHLESARFFWQAIAGGICPKKIKILKGGLSGWMESDAPVETDSEFNAFNMNIKPITEEHDLVKFWEGSSKKFRADHEHVFSTIEKQVNNLAIDKFDASLPLLIDTRPGPMFQQAHMPGAVNLPYPSMLLPLQEGSFGFNSQVNEWFKETLMLIDLKRNHQQIETTPENPIELIFTCQTGQTASTGFVGAFNYLKSKPDIMGKVYSLENVRIQVFDPSFYIYGNPQFDVPGVQNSCERRHFERGPSKIEELLLAQ